MKVAVFGSREGFTYEEVRDYLEPRFRADVTLVSGGAPGVDTWAENTWRLLGGHVISLRPVKIDLDSYAVERWETEEQRVFVPLGQPEWADFKSAAYYRDMLLADEGDRGVAFWHNFSRGTSHTIDAFKAEGKECAIHRK